jgi:hypothetical protein
MRMNLRTHANSPMVHGIGQLNLNGIRGLGNPGLPSGFRYRSPAMGILPTGLNRGGVGDLGQLSTTNTAEAYAQNLLSLAVGQQAITQAQADQILQQAYGTSDTVPTQAEISAQITALQTGGYSAVTNPNTPPGLMGALAPSSSDISTYQSQVIPLLSQTETSNTQIMGQVQTALVPVLGAGSVAQPYISTIMAAGGAAQYIAQALAAGSRGTPNTPGAVFIPGAGTTGMTTVTNAQTLAQQEAQAAAANSQAGVLAPGNAQALAVSGTTTPTPAATTPSMTSAGTSSTSLVAPAGTTVAAAPGTCDGIFQTNGLYPVPSLAGCVGPLDMGTWALIGGAVLLLFMMGSKR